MIEQKIFFYFHPAVDFDFLKKKIRLPLMSQSVLTRPPLERNFLKKVLGECMMK